ncbi:MAG: WYL domain-containing protein [Actinobacteria bacterium]|nr:MAG: WYL domain-containing protein [Actinomycetota bacterium]REK35514.1 MAG: WYL domain-containing protein [Actinomycetota bacterium]
MSSQKTVSRLSRILGLIPYVLANPGVSTEEVMERFGYSRSELTRDLNAVFVCGLPGYGPGELMEAYIDEDEVVIDSADYFSRAPRLAPIEALGLLAAALAVSGSGQGTPALDSAIAKLSDVLLPEADATLAVDLPPSTDSATTLKRAAAENRVTHIVYRSLSREETTERDIEPWLVFSTLGNWYVMAHCRLVDDMRTFRIDRIRSVEVLEERFDPPDEIPEPGVGYSPSDNDVTATIDLFPGARWVLEYYPVEILEEGDDHVRIRFSATDPELPARLLLRLGGSARLVEGPDVSERLKHLGKALSDRYG